MGKHDNDLESMADVAAYWQHGGVCRRPREHVGAIQDWFGGAIPPAKDGVATDGSKDSTGRGVLRGRGHGLVDLVVRTTEYEGAPESLVPMCLKGHKKKGFGNRDISLYGEEAVEFSKNGGILWVCHLWMVGGQLMMRRIDAARIIRELPGDMEQTKLQGIGPDKVWGFRFDPRCGGKYEYWRLRIEWSRVPASYWLDKSTVPFDSRAPLY